jgi:hypothetical protein
MFMTRKVLLPRRSEIRVGLHPVLTDVEAFNLFGFRYTDAIVKGTDD